MNKPRILTAGVAALLAFPSLVLAVDRNWTGGGTPGNWNDPANWDTGVPTTDTGDNIFLHLPGALTGPAINAGTLYIGAGTPGDANTGFTFGTGTYNLVHVRVGEAHDGVNPTSNRFGRATINAGTTLNISNDFFLGEWDGGSGHVIHNGGDVVVNGQFRVGHWPQNNVGGGVDSTYTMNGGTFTVNGDPSSPTEEGQAGNVFLGIDSTGILVINNGVFSSKGITLDNRGATAGEDTLEVNGGLVNLGANGIVSQNAGNPGTYEVRLRGGTLRATASWTSDLETTLASGGSGIVYDTNGNNITLGGAVRGAGGLTKVGAGSLILTGPNDYSGGTTINAGNVIVGNGGTSGSLGLGPVAINTGTTLDYNRTDGLTVPGAVSGVGALDVNTGALRLANVSGGLTVTVANGATFGAAGTVSTVTAGNASVLEAGAGGAGDFTTSTLTINDGTLKVSLGAQSAKFVVTSVGGFAPSGTTSIVFNTIGLGVGTYPVLDYNGSIGGGGFGSLSLNLSSRVAASLVNNTGATTVDLNITSIDRPKWSGAIDGNWDTTTPNWQLVTAGGPTTYLNLDDVLFDDTASGTTVVNLDAPVTPSSVTFNNPTKTYTLSGVGGIGGATGLIKQGAGRTILATANSYTGATNVQAGVLQIGDGATGSLTGTTVTISAGAAVELNVVGAYATPTTGPGALRTIGVNNFEVAAGILSGDVLLNIAGAVSQVVNVANQSSHDGDITITSGTLKATGALALGTTAKPTVILDGGALDVNNLDLGAEHVVVSGSGPDGTGAIVNTGTGSTLNLHRVTLSGPASFGGTGRWDIRDGGLPGQLLDLSGFKLTKVGGNQVSMVNIDVTPGDIDINGGIFSVEDNSAVQGTGTITLNTGGSLGLWVNKPGRLTRNIVANGGSITELGSGGATTVDSPLVLNANIDFNTGGNGATVFSYVGSIVEAGTPRAVNVNGAGRLVLLGNNNWTGGFNVNSGFLQVGNGGTAGTLGSGPGTVNGTLVLARSDGFALTGSINAGGPAGGLILVGGGTTTLANGVDIKVNDLNFGVNGQNDTVGGTLNIAEGNNVVVQNTLVMGNSQGGGGANVGVINQTGGSMVVNALDTDGRNFVLGHWPQGDGTYNQSGGTLDSPNISMAISWDGSGTYNLSNGVANVRGLRFGHSANRSGVFNLTGGTLALGDQGIWEQNVAFPNDINLGGGTIMAAANTEIRLPAELTGIGGNTTFNSNGNTLTVSGALSGTAGYTKTGVGTMIVTSPNIYNGTTIVDGGTLLVNNPLGSGTGNGNVDVASGATLGGNGFIGQGGAVVVTVDGKLAPGDTVGTLTMNLGAGTLNVSGAVTGAAIGALEFDLGTANDLVRLTAGSLTIGAGVLEFNDFAFTISGTLAQGDYVLFDTTVPIIGTLGANVTGSLAGGLNGTLQIAPDGNDLILHVVPEPTTTSALLGGLGMLLAGRRRRRNS